MLRGSPRSAPVCFNTLLFRELLPRGLHLPVWQTQGLGAGGVYTRAGTAGGQHPNHMHRPSTNPCFPAGLCAIAYPSALITTGAAAALGFLDGAPSQGGQRGHPQLWEQACCGVAATQAGALGRGQQALPGHGVGPGVEQSRRGVKHR